MVSRTDHGPTVASNGSELFQATYCGRPVVIAQASAEERSVVTQDVDAAGCRDCLERWTLVSIRDSGRPQVNIHALGWRSALRNTWITSRLVSVDLAVGAVATMSGHVYWLGEVDSAELQPALRRHLAFALLQWGFEDVQDLGLPTVGRSRRERASDEG